MNIIDKIYSNSHFTTILIGAIAFLVVLFIIVLCLGIKDAKKAKNPVKKEKEEKDITFEDVPQEPKDVAEDVTFEMGTITKNLEDFKKGLEEELQNDTSEIDTIKEETIEEKPHIEEMNTESIEEKEYSEEEIEDSFLDLINLKKEDSEPVPLKGVEDILEEDNEPVNSNKVEKTYDEDNEPISLAEIEEKKKEQEALKAEELELPKMNDDNKDDLDNEVRRRKERMIDEYLSATKSLSLDEINKKIEEMEKDDF